MRCARRSATAASTTSRTAPTSRLPKRDVSEPVFNHGPGGSREMVHPGNQEYLRGDRIPRPQGGGGGGGGSGASQRRHRRGRLHLPHHARRVHELLLRRPGAAAPDPHAAAGRRAGVEDPPRRLRLRRQPDQPARGALDARGPGPPHRHGRRRAPASCAWPRSTWRSSRRAATRRRPRSPRCRPRSTSCASASSACRSSTRSTCATATASASRCPPARP